MYRGETSPPSPAPWGLLARGSQSPVGHSLSPAAQPGSRAPATLTAPDTFGLEPPAANMARAHVLSQEGPPRCHSPSAELPGGSPRQEAASGRGAGAALAPAGLGCSTGHPQRCHCPPAPCPLPATSGGWLSSWAAGAG